MKLTIPKTRRQVLLATALISVAVHVKAWQKNDEATVGQPASTQAKELHRDEVAHSQAPGPDSVGTKVKCGLNGDIYAAYSVPPSGQFWRNPIRRVSPSSMKVTEYPIPTVAGFTDLSRLSFDVDPNGVLYALFRAPLHSATSTGAALQAAYVVVKYKDNGEVDSFVEVEDRNMGQSQPASLSVFANGNFLVSGTVGSPSSGGRGFSVFSAVYNSSGVYRAPAEALTLARQNGSTAPSETQNPNNVASSSLAVSSPDGNIYFLQGDSLETVSHLGSIERKQIILTPDRDLTALQMAQAGKGSIFVFYDHVSSGVASENVQRRSMINVIDTQTGEVTQTYRLPQAERDFVVASCAASSNDFVFLSSDESDRLQVIHYKYK